MKRKTTEQFIKESKQKHGNVYDYSLSIYRNNRTKLKIICPEHGIFEQSPFSHIKGHGCSKCSGNKKKTIEEFIEESITVHGKLYDYQNSKYINNETPIEIICETHGKFSQSPIKHLSGRGCPKCGGSFPLTSKDFIRKSIDIHGEIYDYSLTNYLNSKTKIIIICPDHGIFEQLPYNHLYGKNGCPHCKSSKGELLIFNLLKKENIYFNKEFYIKEINMYLDFYLPNLKVAIEYDGIQHFKSIEFFGGDKSLEEIKKRDDIKNKYCLNNSIKMIRIPYWEYYNLNEKSDITLEELLELYS